MAKVLLRIIRRCRMKPDMSDEQSGLVEAVELVNISLVHCGRDREADTHLGVVIVPKHISTDLNLTMLRQIMKQQLCQVLPERFVFCSKTKHDIQYGQEEDVYASQICDHDETILIRSSYDAPQLLVKSNSAIQGHLFCNFTSSLTDLRDVICRSLPGFDGQEKTFRFLYSDGSLVPAQEEEKTPVHEALRGLEVQIYVIDQLSKERESHIMPLKCDPEASMDQTIIKPLRLSFSSSKDKSHQPGSSGSVACTQIGSDSKQLLISYVSAEAAEHAVSLKQKLTELGYSVYLDVHEIKSGVDWQDSLNYAVSNCEVFIPLVTPRYGETQWTNREVKLADVLGKPIVPVSFLTEWPPKCLAIQFATTQFILWKSPEIISSEKGDETKDIRLWEEKHIEVVAREIEKRLKILRSIKVSKPALKRMKTLMKTFAGRLPDSIAPELTRQDSEEAAGPQIVICVHPHDAEYGFQLKNWLVEAGYSVWTSSASANYSTFGTAGAVSAALQLAGTAAMIEIKSENAPCIPLDSSIKITAEQVTEFQEAVDKATIIIIVLSKTFTESWICRQQVFYCEHRKQILPVACEELWIPSWLKMLIRTKRLLNVNKPNFYQILLMQIKRALDPTAKNCLETDSQEANITLAVDYLKKSVDVRRSLYVSGASKFTDARTEAVCRSIGTHLAKLSNVAIATGGCYGTSEFVGRTFYEECQKQLIESAVWHVLPEQDSQDMSERYNQSSDGTFALKDFGQTLFCGNNVWEKEAIVGRCFQICLLTEGGPAAGHELEEFVWNDNIIIPVYCAYETDSTLGEHGATSKMFQVPPGVSELDWKCLSDKRTSADGVGKAVANIISDLLKHLDQQSENSAKGQSEWLYQADPRDI